MFRRVFIRPPVEWAPGEARRVERLERGQIEHVMNRDSRLSPAGLLLTLLEASHLNYYGTYAIISYPMPKGSAAKRRTAPHRAAEPPGLCLVPTLRSRHSLHLTFYMARISLSLYSANRLTFANDFLCIYLSIDF